MLHKSWNLHPEILLKELQKSYRWTISIIYVWTFTFKYQKFMCRSSTATYWECSRRRGLNKCTASVIQKNSDFTRGQNTHSHSPIIGAQTNLSIQHNVRTSAKSNIFVSAGAIVQRTVMDHVDVLAPNPELSSIDSLVIKTSASISFGLY